jgi:hypothetical protein
MIAVVAVVAVVAVMPGAPADLAVDAAARKVEISGPILGREYELVLMAA